MVADFIQNGYFDIFARISLCLLYFYLALLFFRNRAKMSSGGKGWSILTLGLLTACTGEVLDLVELLYPGGNDTFSSIKYLCFTAGAYLIVIGGITWIRRIITTIEQLNYETLIDPLTCAYNRRFLADNFERERSAYLDREAKAKKLAVAIIDLDDFKSVNDRYGHTQGDSVLKELALALKANLRSEDYVIRYGGDEFIMICSDVGPENQQAILDRINQAVSSVVLSGGESLTASVGLAFFPQDGIGFKDLLAVADERMYSSKSYAKSFAEKNNNR